MVPDVVGTSFAVMQRLPAGTNIRRLDIVGHDILCFSQNPVVRICLERAHKEGRSPTPPDTYNLENSRSAGQASICIGHRRRPRVTTKQNRGD